MMNRRNFLRGLGGAAATLPFLSSFGNRVNAAPVPGGPRRIIVMSYPMGIARQHWQPQGTGFDFTLPYCTAPLAEFQDRCVFVSNVDMRVNGLLDNGFFGHQMKKECALTGTLPTIAFSGARRNHVDDLQQIGDIPMETQPNGPSICSVVGDFVRDGQPRRSINLGVHGTQWPDERFNSFFSWAAAGSPETLTISPSLAFQDIFAGIGDGMSGPDPAVVAELERRRSVLDAVRGSFGELRSGLDYRDRQRLDLHADYIRQIETDLNRGPLCRQPMGITTDPEWYRTASMSEMTGLHVRMLAQAMACDLAPVGRLEYYYQQGPNFGIASVDEAQAQWDAGAGFQWHGGVHGEVDPTTGRPIRPPREQMDSGEFHPGLLDGLRFYVQSFADLLRELDRFEEGPDGRTVLDNSLCVLATDMGDGYGHGGQRMGYVLAGNLGPYRTGYHLDCAPGQDWWTDSMYDHTAVLGTIAQAFCLRDDAGAEITSFGLEGYADGGLPLPRS